MRDTQPAELKKIVLILSILILGMGTIAAGLYFHHYFVVSVFGVWLLIEFLLWRFPLAGRATGARRPLPGIAHLLSLYKRSDGLSESRLEEKIAEINIDGQLTPAEARVLRRLKDLSELRGLCFGLPIQGRRQLRQGFIYHRNVSDEERAQGFDDESMSVQDITESAMHVASLYWRLYEACLGEYPELTSIAHKLFKDVFGASFDNNKHKDTIETLTDSIQRDSGVVFLILNLLRQKRVLAARQITQRLLVVESTVDEDVRSTIYWMAEINWFTQEKVEPLRDFESTIRYLYHLCFTNPERGGFLEVDSQFYSQFETVNELAREGFLFKETLIEKLLDTWGDHLGAFDAQFMGVLEAMTHEQQKIYNDRNAWFRYWVRNREDFGREYLNLVEGNLCFARGYLEDAKDFYERALACVPGLRAAEFNLLFALSKQGDVEGHDKQAKIILAQPEYAPNSLSVVGNSYMLLGEDSAADQCYEQLKQYPGWQSKADHYRSTFCFENGLFEKALEFARIAHEANPNDSSMLYHLSLCYSSVGEKERALDILKGMRDSRLSQGDSSWLKYYRFTLERDAGRHQEASETLWRIPKDYFNDPDELQAAEEFAKGRQDLALLHHLRKRS